MQYNISCAPEATYLTKEWCRCNHTNLLTPAIYPFWYHLGENVAAFAFGCILTSFGFSFMFGGHE